MGGHIRHLRLAIYANCIRYKLKISLYISQTYWTDDRFGFRDGLLHAILRLGGNIVVFISTTTANGTNKGYKQIRKLLQFFMHKYQTKFRVYVVPAIRLGIFHLKMLIACFLPHLYLVFQTSRNLSKNAATNSIDSGTGTFQETEPRDLFRWFDDIKESSLTLPRGNNLSDCIQTKFVNDVFFGGSNEVDKYDVVQIINQKQINNSLNVLSPNDPNLRIRMDEQTIVIGSRRGVNLALVSISIDGDHTSLRNVRMHSGQTFTIFYGDKNKVVTLKYNFDGDFNPITFEYDIVSKKICIHDNSNSTNLIYEIKATKHEEWGFSYLVEGPRIDDENKSNDSIIMGQNAPQSQNINNTTSIKTEPSIVRSKRKSIPIKTSIPIPTQHEIKQNQYIDNTVMQQMWNINNNNNNNISIKSEPDSNAGQYRFRTSFDIDRNSNAMNNDKRRSMIHKNVTQRYSVHNNNNNNNYNNDTLSNNNQTGIKSEMPTNNIGYHQMSQNMMQSQKINPNNTVLDEMRTDNTQQPFTINRGNNSNNNRSFSKIYNFPTHNDGNSNNNNNTPIKSEMKTNTIENPRRQSLSQGRYNNNNNNNNNVLGTNWDVIDNITQPMQSDNNNNNKISIKSEPDSNYIMFNRQRKSHENQYSNNSNNNINDEQSFNPPIKQEIVDNETNNDNEESTDDNEDNESNPSEQTMNAWLARSKRELYEREQRYLRSKLNGYSDAINTLTNEINDDTLELTIANELQLFDISWINVTTHCVWINDATGLGGSRYSKLKTPITSFKAYKQRFEKSKMKNRKPKEYGNRLYVELLNNVIAYAKRISEQIFVEDQKQKNYYQLLIYAYTELLFSKRVMLMDGQGSSHPVLLQASIKRKAFQKVLNEHLELDNETISKRAQYITHLKQKYEEKLSSLKSLLSKEEV
eukprot:509569_1